MEPGEVVQGRYRVERELGAGGMGSVYLARDLEQDRDVALKVSAAAGRGKEEFRARFEREAAIGCALGQSPGFVRAFDWGELPDGRTLYMAMDLVRGGKPLDLRSGTLRERLRRLEAAAERVASMHALGVVHRDLKPANFLVDEAGTTWLLDFGLAKHRGEAGQAEPTAVDLTRTGVGMGTPVFMAPEQFEDAKAVDPRGDVYALGVMLFYALAGCPPYAGGTGMEVYKEQLAVRQGTRRPPRARDRAPEAPLGLDALAAEATSLALERRTSSAAVFLSALRKGLGRLDEKAASGAVPSLATIDALPPPSSDAPDTPSPQGRSSGLQPSLPSVPPAPAPVRVVRIRARPEPDTGEELSREALATLRIVAPYLAPPLLLLALLVGSAALLRALRATPGTPPAPHAPAPAPAPAPPAAGLAALEARADQGDQEAAWALGQAYELAQGVEENPVLAARWYQRAGSHREALYALGSMYEDGRGVELNLTTARTCYERAARLGHPQAEVRAIALEQRLAWEKQAAAEHRELELEARRRAAEEARQRAAEERRRAAEERRRARQPGG